MNCCHNTKLIKYEHKYGTLTVELYRCVRCNNLVENCFYFKKENLK